MSTRDVTLALLAVAVWGANFTVIRLGLDDVPPLLLAALRYLVAAFPAVLVVPPPALPPGVWVTFGLTNGFGQFACLFTAIHLGLPAGLASVVLQVQALFTTLLAGLLLREPVGRRQAAGLALAASGLGLVATQPGAGSGPIPPLAWALAGGAALCWAVSNILIRRATGPAAAAGEAMVRLVVWSSPGAAVALAGPGRRLGRPPRSWWRPSTPSTSAWLPWSSTWPTGRPSSLPARGTVSWPATPPPRWRPSPSWCRWPDW